MSGEPSKVSGYTDKVTGAIKENVGYIIGNQQMEAEGKIKKEKGNIEVESAKAVEYTKGTGEQIKGNIKEGVGNVIGNEQMQAEGKAERLKGEARKTINS